VRLYMMVGLWLGGRAGAGWRGAGRARGRSTQPGATRPRTHGARQGGARTVARPRASSRAPRSAEGDRGRCGTRCWGQGERLRRDASKAAQGGGQHGATGVACRVCVQRRLGAWHVPVSRADERATAVASVGAQQGQSMSAERERQRERERERERSGRRSGFCAPD
jgi:hypothetical protein